MRLVSFTDPAHLAAVEALDREIRSENELVVNPQVLSEFWAVATRPADANGLGLSVEDAAQELTRFQSDFTFLHEVRGVFDEWQRLVIKTRVIGKSTHDARMAAFIVASELDGILTFNAGDFRRFGIQIIEP